MTNIYIHTYIKNISVQNSINSPYLSFFFMLGYFLSTDLRISPATALIPIWKCTGLGVSEWFSGAIFPKPQKKKEMVR